MPSEDGHRWPKHVKAINIYKLNHTERCYQLFYNKKFFRQWKSLLWSLSDKITRNSIIRYGHLTETGFWNSSHFIFSFRRLALSSSSSILGTQQNPSHCDWELAEHQHNFVWAGQTARTSLSACQGCQLTYSSSTTLILVIRNFVIRTFSNRVGCSMYVMHFYYCSSQIILSFGFVKFQWRLIKIL
jgi:hypothetical protein